MNQTLSATDVLAPISMKNAAKCDTSCELQNQWVIKTLNATCTSFGEYVCWSVCSSPPSTNPSNEDWCEVADFIWILFRWVSRWTKPKVSFVSNTIPSLRWWCIWRTRRLIVFGLENRVYSIKCSVFVSILNRRFIISDLQSVKNTRWI